MVNIHIICIYTFFEYFESGKNEVNKFLSGTRLQKLT
jgi:hypothetical protein